MTVPEGSREAGEGGRAPRVLFYVQHLLGIGHLARISRIAEALHADGFDVAMATGGLAVPGFPGQGIRHIALPPVAVGDEGFSGLVDAQGQPVDEAFKATRRDMLLDAYRDFRPDAVVIEAFPFGRRQVRFELLPLIEAVQQTHPRPLLLTSLRDILQERAKPGRDEETVELVNRFFDHVLVHGDPAFFALEETFPLAEAIRERVIYTGLVAAPPPEPARETFDVVVSAGGGAVGAGLIQASIAAAANMSRQLRWCVITGPNLPQPDFDRFQSVVAGNVELHRFRTDFPSLLLGARASVSQAGYNTVCDILRAGCAAVLVPFEAGGETEQSRRAEKLAALGVARVVGEKDVDGPRIAAALQELLQDDVRRTVPVVGLDGAGATARILRQLLRT